MGSECVNQFDCITDRLLANPYVVVLFRILMFSISTLTVVLFAWQIFRIINRHS